MVGAVRFELTTLCSQRIARQLSSTCAGCNTAAFSAVYTWGILVYVSPSKQVAATVSATGAVVSDLPGSARLRGATWAAYNKAAPRGRLWAFLAVAVLLNRICRFGCAAETGSRSTFG